MKANRPALSSPVEVIAMLKGLKNKRTKHKTRLDINCLVKQTTEIPRVRATLGPSTKNDQQYTLPGVGVGVGVGGVMGGVRGWGLKKG